MNHEVDRIGVTVQINSVLGAFKDSEGRETVTDNRWIDNFFEERRHAQSEISGRQVGVFEICGQLCPDGVDPE